MVIGFGATGTARLGPGDGAKLPAGAVDGRTTGAGLREPDDEALDLRLGGERADGRHRHLRAVGRDLARRDGQVVRLEDPDDLLAGDARRGHLLRVERHEQALLEAAGQVDPRDAVDGLELRDDLDPGDLADRGQIAGPGRRDRRDDDRRGVDVERLDRRRGGRRQVRLGDGLGDRGGRVLDVRAVRELGDDQRDRVRRRRLDDLEPRDAADGVLDRLGHLLGDVGRPGARERRDDRDDREVDVRQQFLLEAAPGRQAGEEQGAGEEERDAPLAEGDSAEATHVRCSP